MIHRYIIEATDEVKGFEKAIEKLDREWGIEELEPCDDTISRQAVDDAIYDYSRACDVDYAQIMEYIDKLPSVTPKTDAIDKIRDEIMDTGAYEQEVNGNTEFLKSINYCLSVIDKYRELEKGVL